MCCAISSVHVFPGRYGEFIGYTTLSALNMNVFCTGRDTKADEK
jgi:hypothetical protein